VLKPPRTRLVSVVVAAVLVLTGVLVPVGSASAASPYPAGSTATVEKSTGTPFVLQAVTTPAVVGSSKAYQWYRVSPSNPSQMTAIAGKKSVQYTPTAADYPFRIMVRVTFTAPGFNPGTVDSLAKDYSIRVTKPVIGGTPTVDQTLSVPAPTIDRELTFPESTGRTDASSDFALNLRWYANGVRITSAQLDGAPANAATITLSAALRGKKITMDYLLNGSRTGYLSPPVITSAATAAVALATLPDAFTSTINVSGSSNTLTAIFGGETTPGVDEKYQWFRNGVAIAGQKGFQYVRGPLDAGKQLRVDITFSKLGYTSRTVASDSKNFTLIAQGLPRIQGAPAVDEILDIIPTTYIDALTGAGPASAVITYQWLRNGTVVQTDGTYEITAADKGKVISLRAIATMPGRFPSTTTSVATQTIGQDLQPGWNERPTVSVDASSTTLKTVLRATSGVDVPASPAKLTVKFQWFRNGAAIKGAVSALYPLSAADYGKDITVRALTTRTPVGAFTPSLQTSDPTDWSLVQSTDDGSLNIYGAFAFGTTLDWTGSGSTRFGSPVTTETHYQWLRTVGTKTTAIPHSDFSDYVLGISDIGAKISVKVTMYMQGGGAVPWTKSYTTSPANLTVSKATFMAIPDSPSIDRTAPGKVAAVAGGWDPTPTKFTYIWTRNGAIIPKATSVSYTLAAADKGKLIRVHITSIKAGYVSAAEDAPGIPIDLIPDTPDAVIGTPQVGVPLTTNTVTYEDAGSDIPTVTRKVEWLRLGKVVGTGASYTPSAADFNATLSIRVTATAPGYLALVTTAVASPKVIKGHTTTFGSPSVEMMDANKTLRASLVGLVPAAPAPVVSYQWYRSTAADPGSASKITGQTGRDYKPTAADAGKTIFVEILSSRPNFDNGAVTRVTSTPKDYTLKRQQPVSVFVSAPKVGNLAQVVDEPYNTTDSNNVAAALTYTWMRNGVVIPDSGGGATYSLRAADLGKKITVRETATFAGYMNASGTSNATPTIGKGDIDYDTSAKPVFTKTTGSTFSAAIPPGAITTPGTPHLTNRWERLGVKVSTSSTYTLTGADTEKAVVGFVIVTIDGYNPITISGDLNRISFAGTPQISDSTPTLADILSVSAPVTVNGTPTITYTYLWRNGESGVPLSGGDPFASTYFITLDEVGKKIVVTMTATAPGYIGDNELTNTTDPVVG
jgi:hypothetical protein